MTFRAKYRGTCASCEDRIHEGQMVEYNFDGDLQHSLCPESLDAFGHPRPVCPLCFCEIPASGVCDCRE